MTVLKNSDKVRLCRVKNKIKSIGLMMVISLFFLFSAGCGESKSSIEETSGNEGIKTNQVPDDRQKKNKLNDSTEDEDAFDSAELPDPDTSFDKIDADFENGKISELKAMELKLVAGYYPGRLPARYKTDVNVDSSSQIQATMYWLYENFDSLDEGSKELFAPFYLPPNADENILYKDESQLNKIIDILTKVSEADAATVLQNRKVEINGEGKTTIYYSDTQYNQSVWIEEALADSWNAFGALLHIDIDAPILIQLVSGVDWWGTACPGKYQNKKYYRIQIRDDLGMDKTKAVLAHELFHCFQYSMGIIYRNMETQWIMEATATWSMHYIYPETNKEQFYLSGFFYYLPKDLIYWGGKRNQREYNTYMFIMFLTQKLNSNSIVADLLYKSKTEGAQKAVEEISGFDRMYADFALWNYDHEEFKIYKDYPEHLPDNSEDGYPTSPYGIAKTRVWMKQVTSKAPTINLGKGGIKYNANIFSKDIGKVNFTFEKGSEKHRLIAIVRLEDGSSYVEDWSDLEERSFCKSIPFEDVKIVTLIFANSDLNAPYSTSYVVETEKDCYEDGYGITTLEWDNRKTINVSGSSSTTIDSGTFTQRDVIKYSGDGDYEVLRQSVSFSSQNAAYAYGDGSCGWDHDHKTNEKQGSYFRNFENQRYKPSKIKVELDDNDKKTDRFYFETDPNVPEHDWISSVTTIDSLWVPCESSIAPTLNYHIIETEDKIITLPCEPFDFIHDPDDRQISGTRIYDGNGYDATLTYDYTLK